MEKIKEHPFTVLYHYITKDKNKKKNKIAAKDDKLLLFKLRNENAKISSFCQLYIPSVPKHL